MFACAVPSDAWNFKFYLEFMNFTLIRFFFIFFNEFIIIMIMII